ncbi:hypothetical protein NC653_006827 [Populus alba x Populus x berolinensis]|uniref:Uncharacterized protein n=1 Tax=Populus alba x Populus x berolinensis TaxID=444605 RepID=A0AAD6WD31_9ROSI|nr:hypothetical protein NC653_006827 [Populus alba x Populus x berolinensis]
MTFLFTASLLNNFFNGQQASIYRLSLTRTLWNKFNASENSSDAFGAGASQILLI